jgi:hypothetical protein
MDSARLSGVDLTAETKADGQKSFSYNPLKTQWLSGTISKRRGWRTEAPTLWEC